MYCRECGQENIEHALFCQRCGIKLQLPPGVVDDSVKFPAGVDNAAAQDNNMQNNEVNRNAQPEKQSLIGRVASGVKSVFHKAPEETGTPLKGNKLILFSGIGVALVAIAIVSYFIFRPVITVGTLSILAPDEIIPGDGIIVSGEVKNTGRTRGTYEAVLFLNDEEYAVKKVTVDAGDKQTIQFELVGEAIGYHTVSLDEVTETFRVLKPAEFTLSQLSVSPNPAKKGDEVTITVRVENKGEASGSHTVNFTIDGEVVKKEEVTLKGETSRTVMLNMDADKGGSFDIGVGNLRRNLVIYDIQRLAHGTYINRDMTGGSNRLLIRDLGSDAVVVMTKVDDTTPLISVYVRKGNSFTVYGIWNGTYDLFIATGEEWDTASKRFTQNAWYEQFDTPMSFTSSATQYTQWTVYRGAGSGDGTRSISEQAFPRL